MLNNRNNKVELAEITYIKKINVGTINPSAPFSTEDEEKQVALLNRCLKEGRGIIIGRDTSVGTFQLGDHQISMQKTSYHVGFRRKPYWLEED